MTKAFTLLMLLATPAFGQTVAVKVGDVIQGHRIAILGANALSQTLSGTLIGIPVTPESWAWEAMPLQLMDDGTPVFAAQTDRLESGIFTPSRVIALKGMRVGEFTVETPFMLRARNGVAWAATLVKDGCRTCRYFGVFKNDQLLGDFLLNNAVLLDIAVTPDGSVYHIINGSVVYRDGVEWLRIGQTLDGCQVGAFMQGMAVSPSGRLGIPVTCKTPYRSAAAWIDGHVISLRGLMVGLNDDGTPIERGVVSMPSSSASGARFWSGEREILSADWKIRGTFAGGHYAILTGGQFVESSHGRFDSGSINGLAGRGTMFALVMPAVNRSGDMAFLVFGENGSIIVSMGRR